MGKKKKVSPKGPPKATPKKAVKKKGGRAHYTASIHCKTSIPKTFVDQIANLENELGLPVWLLVHPMNKRSRLESISEELAEQFIEHKDSLPSGTKVALVLNSPGGQARPAFRIAKLLRDRCGGFTAIIPRVAKSAATLLALGADQIIIGDEGELGPLDAQIYDPEREEFLSALDETQAVESLENAAMDTADTLLLLLKRRTGKKVQSLMPPVLHFAAEIMKPLFDKIDSVRYSQMSRIQKEAEEYAIRLLSGYGTEAATAISQKLVSKYTDHGFVIDRQEAREVGLNVPETSASVPKVLDALFPHLAGFATPEPEGISAIGKLERIG